MFQRILIANRGEIALRVIRACKDLGIESVAVYSEADRHAPYLALADQAVCIGPPPAVESYLSVSRLIAAAEKAEAQAIHPGYGFLSENARFAEVCRDCRITFIGPPPEAMHRLGAAFVLCCHPFLSGRPSRAAALERLIERMRSLDGLWITTVGAVAKHTKSLNLTPRTCPRPVLPADAHWVARPPDVADTA